jgi:large subunit ribosomal protein L6
MVNDMEVVVKIPQKTEVKVDGRKISVSGTKGKLEKDFSSPLFDRLVKIAKDGDLIKVSTGSSRRKVKSQTGCVAAHIRNMMKGANSGYTARLKVVFMHFPVTVKAAGNEITVANFLGEKSPRKAQIVGETNVDVKGEEITVTGLDRDAVGQTAANIERATHVPARDRRVFQDGIFVTQKTRPTE